ncbi:hypothetical protein Hypma_008597 [Hypsizygus marmoreus]|uniref:Mid2 domain-containing protein n=1 Tax=Hypsizygus marmoreus TaxID=39966 RepID=A0A369JSC1_HYPMA|nr:hypothetical protein Hypma_008597 [Hypsizygus marmoreus]
MLRFWLHIFLLNLHFADSTITQDMETALWQSLCLVQLLMVLLVSHGSHALILNVTSIQFFNEAFRVTWTYNLSDPALFRFETVPTLAISPQRLWDTNDGQAILLISPDPGFHSFRNVQLVPLDASYQDDISIGQAFRLLILTKSTSTSSSFSSSYSPSNAPPPYTSSSNIITQSGTPSPSQSDSHVTSKTDNVAKSSARTVEPTTLGGPANPTSTSMSPPDTPSPKKPQIRAIVGGSVGGSVLLLTISICALVVARRRRNGLQRDAIIVPLAHDQNYSQPLDKRGQLQEVLLQKAEAQRQRDVLQTDLVERNRTADGSANLPEGENEARMRQQMKLMGQRILELEAQQDELMSNMRPLDESPPPSYF